MDDFEHLFIFLHEIYHRRNHMRMVRYNLRDSQNPFEMNNTHYVSYFRLTKELTTDLINLLLPYEVIARRSTRIPFMLRVLATLYFLSNGSYQKQIGGFNYTSCSQSVVSRNIFEVTQLITRHLMPIWVKFPTNRHTKLAVKTGFFQKYNLREIVGAIDGTHIEIIAPPQNDIDHPPFVYINRKGKHSINVMLICDSDSMILAVDARYPGSVHDAAIWQMSDIKTFMRNSYDDGDHQSILIGDSGYGLEPWLLTPFAQYDEGSPEERFNVRHKNARNVIERTNGILKARFRCLSRHRVLNYHPSRAAYIIYSCAVLHNMAIKARLEIPDHEIDLEQMLAEDNQDPLLINNQPENNLLNRGRQRRELYIQENII